MVGAQIAKLPWTEGNQLDYVFKTIKIFHITINKVEKSIK